ncbi:MAG: flagellar basal body L-ring protein FlgH, partial [Burkholderiaceae bacterium]|nr:flagellar basal body L-ring protein FlgH [Burkholderiaceae bacterium]
MNWFLMGCMIVGLTACATVPDTITHKTPTEASKPREMPATGGAIFQTSAYRPLFEDRRARMVGDTLTVVINEKTTAA